MPFSNHLCHCNQIGQVINDVFWHCWNATSSCCETRNRYFNRKNQGIFN